MHSPAGALVFILSIPSLLTLGSSFRDASCMGCLPDASWPALGGCSWASAAAGGGEEGRACGPQGALRTLRLRGGGKAGGCKAKHLGKAKEGRRVMAGKHAFPSLALGSEYAQREAESQKQRGALVARSPGDGDQDMRPADRTWGSEDSEEDSFESYSSDVPAREMANMKRRVGTMREILPQDGVIPLTNLGRKVYGAVELAQHYEGKPIKVMRQARPPEHGDVWAFGANYDGQLGLADGCKMDRREPMRLLFLPPGPVRAASAGGQHSLVLCGDGTVQAFGLNAFGQLGDGTLESAREPRAVAGLPGPASAVAAGGGHSLAAVEGGGVFAWGRASEGQVPGWEGGKGHKMWGERGGAVPMSGRKRAWAKDAARRAVREPRAVECEALKEGVRGIAAGGSCCAAVDAKGAVWCWGTVGGGFGATGVERVRGVAGAAAVAVAAGESHCLALDEGGGVWAWGDNGSGQLGTAKGGGRKAAPVEGLGGKALGIAAGGNASAALLEGGRVVVWGQLGPPSSASPRPRDVGGLPEGEEPAQVATSGQCCLVLMRTGAVYAWGGNERGQCGTGESSAGKGRFLAAPKCLRGLPAQMGCRAVSAGALHSVALTMQHVAADQEEEEGL